ncbi:MAG: cupin domain-containing protein [Rubricoccaceae bacterium]|nr:cupin domain-containing protein [Rubricoccaceae bacterium]
MITANLDTLDLMDMTAADDPDQACRVTFPLLGTHGTEATAAVYFELEPGKNVGRHTDSAEEVLVVLQGEVRASVGDETVEVGAGSLLVVPTMAPHDVTNIGDETAKVLGVFGGANHIVATFDHGWGPDRMDVVGTRALAEPSAS